MQVALVSPYSWTYPGGVTRHIEALAVELLASGHDVRVLAPYDRDERRTAWLHRGSRPQHREAPEWLISLGPTIGWPLNGAVSNLAPTPFAIATLRRELRTGGYDVVHLHEPVAPVVGWDALTSTDAPTVGTFHCYSEARIAARRRQSARRPPQAQPARRADRGVRGRRLDRPALLRRHLPRRPERRRAARGRGPGAAHASAGRAAGDRVRRPGRRAQGPADPAARLRGAARARARAADRRRRVRARGGAAARRPRGRHDPRPRLGRREARRARGRRRARRAVAGRRVVRDGPDRGLRGRHAGRRLGHRRLPRRRVRRRRRPARSRAATRPRWPRRCATSRSTPSARPRSAPPPPTAPRATPGRRWPRRSPRSTRTRARCRSPRARRSALAVRYGFRSADLGPRRPARRLPSLEPAPAGVAHRAGKIVAPRRDRRRRARRGRRAPTSRSTTSAWTAIGKSLVTSSPAWVLVGLAIMCISMVFRAVSWQAILKAALPESRPRFTDAWQGTAVGVLMSATLPARLGEPSRALIVARRLGRPRQALAGRRRHARLPDAAQRARAGDPRHRHVLDRRPLRGQASRR